MRAKRRQISHRKEDRASGLGYVGRWIDGTMGWCLPSHLSGLNHGPHEEPSDTFNENATDADRAVLCRITVTVVKDKLGREITRRPKRPVKS